jgi:hypothetical protein
VQINGASAAFFPKFGQTALLASGVLDSREQEERTVGMTSCSQQPLVGLPNNTFPLAQNTNSTAREKGDLRHPFSFHWIGCHKQSPTMWAATPDPPKQVVVLKIWCALEEHHSTWQFC